MNDRLRKIEADLAEDEPVVRPGDDNYVEIRTRMIEAAQSAEELEWVKERYPYWTPEAEAAEDLERQLAERQEALDEALANPDLTDEERDEVYDQHPLPSAMQSDPAYEKAVSEANTPEELDEVYRRFGKPVPTP